MMKAREHKPSAREFSAGFRDGIPLAVSIFAFFAARYKNVFLAMGSGMLAMTMLNLLAAG